MDRSRGTAQGPKGPTPSAPIQPRVSTEELTEFTRTPEAQRLARLEADTDLMFRLSAEGFEGRAWREVSRALAEYGYTVMRAWTVTGQVFAKLREKGGHGLPPPPPRGIPQQDALDLATDTVADAIINFRDKVLKTGRWDPSKGASLTTFFVGNCLLQFPNLYRKWQKDWERRTEQFAITGPADGSEDHPAVQLTANDDPAAEVVDRDHDTRVVRRILGPVRGDTNKTILALRADGYGIDEIAEILGLTYKQVEARIYRARQQVRTHREEEA